jgi:hypothetical protein
VRHRGIRSVIALRLSYNDLTLAEQLMMSMITAGIGPFLPSQPRRSDVCFRG